MTSEPRLTGGGYMSAEPRPTISAWVCGECDYWQQYKGQGVHQTANPSDPRGPLAIHVLREVWFVPEAVRVVLAERVSTLEDALALAETLARHVNDFCTNEAPAEWDGGSLGYSIGGLGACADDVLTALAGLGTDPATQETA